MNGKIIITKTYNYEKDDDNARSRSLLRNDKDGAAACTSDNDDNLNAHKARYLSEP